MGYLGKQPSAVPLTTADLIDGSITNADIADLDAAKLTGTVNNARISLDAAEIPNLDAAKITSGDIALARLGNAPATDLTPVRQDIAMLALYSASADNKEAYNLPNSFIDQFEDSTGLTTLTDVTRATGEYVASIVVGTTVDAVASKWTQSVANNVTFSDNNITWVANGDKNIRLNDSFTGDFEVILTWTGTTPPTGGNFVAMGLNFVSDEPSVFSNVNVINYYWTSCPWYRDSSGASPTYGQTLRQANAISEDSTIKWTRVGNTIGVYNDPGSTGTFSLDYEWPETFSTEMRFGLSPGGGAAGWLLEDVKYSGDGITGDLVNNAAGTVISTANTALTAPTTGDIVLLIEEVDGVAATLNTAGNDLRCAISRNGGTGWDYVALENKGLWGTNKKILVANDVPFSNSASGTDMRYKLEWANQANGTRVVRVHATSLAWA